MVVQNKSKACILVIEDIEETRDGIEILLQADGYMVESARSLALGYHLAIKQSPDLILISLPGSNDEIVEAAHRLRLDAGLTPEKVPVVIFCVEGVATGKEVPIGRNIYLTHLDNFNQLRAFFKQLLN
jgi:DNA-binding response OmpR family regulator